MNLIENILLLLNDKTILNTSYGSLLWWLIATLGATLGITHSKLFKGLRERISFLNCAQCVGFWVGPIIYFLDNWIVNLFFSSSFLCTVAYLLLTKSLKNHF